MNCQDFLSRYSDYVDGLLPPLDAALLHEHRISCGRCSRYDQVMQRGLELARAMPAVEPSSDFHLRLQHRLLHVRDDAAADASRAGGGAAVSLAVAGLLALAAWGPLLRSDDGSDAVAYTARPPVEAAAMPMPMGDDVRPVPGESAWWAPASLTTPPRPLTGAFPGPYSPLVVTPPTADFQAGVVRAVLAIYSGLE
jgi:anti-sigma factor RsiW